MFNPTRFHTISMIQVSIFYLQLSQKTASLARPPGCVPGSRQTPAEAWGNPQARHAAGTRATDFLQASPGMPPDGPAVTAPQNFEMQRILRGQILPSPDQKRRYGRQVAQIRGGRRAWYPPCGARPGSAVIRAHTPVGERATPFFEIAVNYVPSLVSRNT